MTDVERPDDTWLREGGHEDVANYIAALVAEKDTLKADNNLFRIQLFADKLAFEVGTARMNESAHALERYSDPR